MEIKKFRENYPSRNTIESFMSNIPEMKVKREDNQEGFAEISNKYSKNYISLGNENDLHKII